MSAKGRLKPPPDPRDRTVGKMQKRKTQRNLSEVFSTLHLWWSSNKSHGRYNPVSHEWVEFERSNQNEDRLEYALETPVPIGSTNIKSQPKSHAVLVTACVVEASDNEELLCLFAVAGAIREAAEVFKGASISRSEPPWLKNSKVL